VSETPIRVLIIDDSPEDREIYRRHLVGRGGTAYVVEEAGTGTQGLERVRERCPDGILLDYRLPDIDGLSLVTTLVAECGPLPIVFLTGAATEELAMRALGAGAQDYLVKERVDAESLARSLRYAIERNRAAARLAALNRELREELDLRLAELRAAHPEAMRNQRLAALGTLAAGVAHDLNNPLMGVITHVQFGMRRLPETDQTTRDALEKALKYSKRCADIVNDLLAYSRDSVRQPAGEADLRGNVYRALDEALSDTHGAQEGAGVTVTVDLPSGLPQVRVDSSGMRQVFVNLIANACDAMRGMSERTLTVRARRDGAHVVLTFRDSGHGMDEQAAKHAFEPFFTTKEKTGTGLGLALCKKLIETVGGRIELASTAGDGATFTLHLPAASPIVRGDEAPAPPSAEP
jgi:signal transduction histidine kinase